MSETSFFCPTFTILFPKALVAQSAGMRNRYLCHLLSQVSPLWISRLSLLCPDGSQGTSTLWKYLLSSLTPPCMRRRGHLASLNSLRICYWILARFWSLHKKENMSQLMMVKRDCPRRHLLSVRSARAGDIAHGLNCTRRWRWGGGR